MSPEAKRAQRRRQARRDNAREGQERSRHEPQRGGSRGRVSRTQLAIASAVAIIAVVALVWVGNAANNAPVTTLPPAITQNGHLRGQANAPVKIEEWADFQCPACGQFARQTEPQLFTTYVAMGQVAISFHHFAFLGPESNWAAEASECASEQGKFWEYHDKLYASQAGENRGAFSKDNLKRFGAVLGLTADFSTCVDSGRYALIVRDDTKLGEVRGVTATPTLFINGRKIEGAASIDQLKAIIDPLLIGK